MPPQENTQRLLDLMAACRLSIEDVAKLTGRSKQTVKIWRCSNSQNIPSMYLAILEMHHQRLRAAEFIEARLEYLQTAIGTTLILYRAVELAAACRAYLASGVLPAADYENYLSAGRDFLRQTGVPLPSGYLEEN